MSQVDEAVMIATRKVIFADDNSELMDVIKQLLELEGYEVRLSLNAGDLNELIARERPGIILLDIHMMGIDGCDVCKGLKKGKTTRDIPVILISANDNLQKAAEYCGADGYLSKPFELEELIRKMQVIHENKTGNRF